MRLTTTICDRCGVEITAHDRSWRAALVESHGAHTGTMGQERQQHYDLCSRCGDTITDEMPYRVGPSTR